MARTENLLGADAAGIPPVLSPSTAGLDLLNVLRQRAAGQQAAPSAAAAALARPILPSASPAASFGAGNTARFSDATSGSLGGEFLDEGTSFFLSSSRVPGGVLPEALSDEPGMDSSDFVALQGEGREIWVSRWTGRWICRGGASSWSNQEEGKSGSAMERLSAQVASSVKRKSPPKLLVGVADSGGLFGGRGIAAARNLMASVGINRATSRSSK